MSPLLFNVFINDIPELLHISNCDPVDLGNYKGKLFTLCC